MEIIVAYFGILLECFQFDVEFYSNGWWYLPLMIPVIFYTVFFCMKWYVLTLPIWLPFVLIIGALRGRSITPEIRNTGRNMRRGK